MNSKGNKVILLLVVGLAALSSAVRELNEVRLLGLQVNEFVVQWSEKLNPADVPPVPVETKLETCENKQSEPFVELPWLENVEESVPVPPVVKRAKVKRERQLNFDPGQFEVRILNDHDNDRDVPAAYDFPPAPASFKFKSRKHGSIRISPRDREILKTLNRSINLRIAS